MMKIINLVNKNYALLLKRNCSNLTDRAIDGVSNIDVLHDVIVNMLDKEPEFFDDSLFIDEVEKQLKIQLFRNKANSLIDANTTIEEVKDKEIEE